MLSIFFFVSFRFVDSLELQSKSDHDVFEPNISVNQKFTDCQTKECPSNLVQDYFSEFITTDYYGAVEFFRTTRLTTNKVESVKTQCTLKNLEEIDCKSGDVIFKTELIMTQDMSKLCVFRKV